MHWIFLLIVIIIIINVVRSMRAETTKNAAKRSPFSARTWSSDTPDDFGRILLPRWQNVAAECPSGVRCLPPPSKGEFPALVGSLHGMALSVTATADGTGGGTTVYRIKFPRSLGIGLFLIQGMDERKHAHASRRMYNLSSVYGENPSYSASADSSRELYAFLGDSIRRGAVDDLMDLYDAVLVNDLGIQVSEAHSSIPDPLLVDHLATTAYALFHAKHPDETATETIPSSATSVPPSVPDLPPSPPQDTQTPSPVLSPVPSSAAPVRPSSPVPSSAAPVRPSTPVPPVVSPARESSPVRASSPASVSAPVTSSVPVRPRKECSSSCDTETLLSFFTRDSYDDATPSSERNRILGAKLSFSGVLRSQYEYCTDFVFGNTRGIRTVFETPHAVTNGRQIRFVVSFPPDSAECFRGKNGQTFQVSGTVCKLDSFSFELFLSGGSLS